jgi:superfamily II DNA or RNA helicase
VAPTGSGKTQIAAEIARYASERGRSVLWLTHTVELVEQSRRRVPWATVRSVQSLLGGDRPRADVVFLDEAHHFVAPQWHDVAADYSGSLLIGLTATPERADGTALGNLFTALVVAAQTRELIRDGYLVPCRVWWPGKVLDGILDPIATWSANASALRTIVYGGSVAQSRQLADEWPVRAACVDGETDSAARSASMAAFASGGLQVLTNVFVLTEGIDVPAVECVVLARGFSSCSAYLQAVGRALRPSPGKTEALILDLHGSSFDHGVPDADRVYSLDGKAIRAVADEQAVRECRVCGTVFQDPGDVCPRCGATVSRVETRAQRIARNAELRELKAADVARAKERWSDIKAGWRERRYRPALSDLFWAASELGYSRGWAVNMYRVYYGQWPRRAA